MYIIYVRVYLKYISRLVKYKFMEKIVNKLIYGNEEGMPNNLGKCTNEYDEFLKPIMAKDIEVEIEEGKNECIEATGLPYEMLDEELYDNEKEF